MHYVWPGTRHLGFNVVDLVTAQDKKYIACPYESGRVIDCHDEEAPEGIRLRGHAFQSVCIDQYHLYESHDDSAGSNGIDNMDSEDGASSMDEDAASELEDAVEFSNMLFFKRRPDDIRNVRGKFEF